MVLVTKFTGMLEPLFFLIWSEVERCLVHDLHLACREADEAEWWAYTRAAVPLSADFVVAHLTSHVANAVDGYASVVERKLHCYENQRSIRAELADFEDWDRFYRKRVAAVAAVQCNAIGTEIGSVAPTLVCHELDPLVDGQGISWHNQSFIEPSK